MGLLDTMKEADEQQSTLEKLQSLTSLLDAQAKQLRGLTNAVNSLSKYVEVMDEAHMSKLKALTSQQSELPSHAQLDDVTKNRLSEIEKTLGEIGNQLSASAAVKLSDGEVVKRSDIDSYRMMQVLESRLKTTTSSLDNLTKTVGNGRTVKFDYAKVKAYVIEQLDKSLTKAVQAPVQRVECAVEGFEQRVSKVGVEKVSEAAQRVDVVLDKADDLVVEMGRAERRLQALEGKVTWAAVGRLCLALLPLAATLLVIGGLVMGVAYAAGFGSLLGWAWSSFSAAQACWAKLLIALGTLTGVVGFGALVWWLAKRLGEDFRHW
ncbi:hypothetical protein M0E82_08435 [Corynebacterium sp. P7202]|uniref:Uncharacterized protein n=1 Tax=Corynebacterium pygosceleis TaxID=2800406 RepID=A0A9Q4C8M3_9CORY|nr:hypothetical protein [Corynebacterium pygosceleis]MCK7638021.1 hypothetical protein [Corynebacterium pygosceleis]MCX7468737.1 hypothetical protein [Corynebacterium pygosceleis]